MLSLTSRPQMFLQTFLLGLTEQDVDSCVEVSVTGYPDVIRKSVGIPDDLDILVGVAIGYEDKTQKVNRIRSTRLPVAETTVFLDA